MALIAAKDQKPLKSPSPLKSPNQSTCSAHHPPRGKAERDPRGGSRTAAQEVQKFKDEIEAQGETEERTLNAPVVVS